MLPLAWGTDAPRGSRRIFPDEEGTESYPTLTRSRMTVCGRRIFPDEEGTERCS